MKTFDSTLRFYEVPKSKLEANWSRRLLVMIEQLPIRQTLQFYKYR